MAIYLQEIAAIDRGGKEAYLELLRTRWVPYAERTRGMKLLWVGSTVGSSARWPETMAIWEISDWERYAETCARMYTESTGEPELRDWWQEACRLRLRSRSRTLVGAPFCPTLAELQSRGVGGVIFAFSSYRVRPGGMTQHLESLRREAESAARRGRVLVGAYEVAFTNDEAYAVWAHESLKDVAAYESGRRVGEGAGEWSECWGYAVPGSPLWPKHRAAGARIW